EEEEEEEEEESSSSSSRSSPRPLPLLPLTDMPHASAASYNLGILVRAGLVPPPKNAVSRERAFVGYMQRAILLGEGGGGHAGAEFALGVHYSDVQSESPAQSQSPGENENENCRPVGRCGGGRPAGASHYLRSSALAAFAYYGRRGGQPLHEGGTLRLTEGSEGVVG
ncbi:hypothetical protein ScalyP_jg3868, partial [Parmales sp. scaly parma]